MIFWLILTSLVFASEYDDSNDFEKLKDPIRFANRFFIKNTLIEIFGDTEQVKSLIDKNFFKVGGQVGGPCDIYEQVYHSPEELLDPNVECPKGKSASKFDLFPKSNLLRSSYLVKTCYELSINRELPSNLRSELFFKNLSRAFYPYGGDKELMIVVKSKYSDLSGISRKKALLTYCVSSKWQEL